MLIPEDKYMNSLQQIEQVTCRSICDRHTYMKAIVINEKEGHRRGFGQKIQKREMIQL